MNKSKAFVAALIMTLATTAACQASPQDAREGREDIIDFSAEDKAMNAAKAEAQKTLPTFLAILVNPAPNTDMIGFKYPLGGDEHIWVDNVKRDGDYLTGTLSNVPVKEGYQLGDAVRVPLKDVSDWSARVDGTMQGHYTTRVILPHIPPADAAEIKEQFGWE